MALSGVALAFSSAMGAKHHAAGEPSALWQPDERPRWLATGMFCALVVMMIVPEGFDYSHLVNAESPAVGSAASRLLWLLLLFGAAASLLCHPSLTLRLLRELNKPLLLFVLLAAASIAWSADPGVTIRKTLRVLTMLLVALSVVLVGWHVRRFQNVLRPLLTVVLLASLLFGLGWPQFAIHQETDGVLQGAWRGLANHKNGFGNLAAITLVLWGHAWLARQITGLHAALGAAVAIACLLLSRSSTSLIAAVFTLLFLLLLLRAPNNLRRHMPVLVTLFVATLLLYSLAILNLLPGSSMLLAPITLVTGKDLSFTGRTEIWNLVIAHSHLSPLIGSGFGAYWVGPGPGSAVYDLVVALNFYPGSAHNGYLEILNDLGLVGLLVLIAYLAVYLRQSLQLLPVDRAQAALYLALFLQQAVVNLSESRWLNAHSVDLVIMTLATAALARSWLEHRLQQELGLPGTPHAQRNSEWS